MDMVLDDIRLSIEEQLQKLEDDAELASVSNFCLAQRWDAVNTRLGLMIVLFSGALTGIGAYASVGDFAAFQKYYTLASTVLAAAATVVTSVLTFLKPSARSATYREFGNKQDALRNRIRLYRAVLMKQDPSVERLSEQLVAFGQEKDTLNSDNPPIPHSAARSAVKDMIEKRQHWVKLGGS
jgi:hypothetical protein